MRTTTEVIAKVVTFTVESSSCRSLWMWSPERENRLTVAFFNDDDPVVWTFGTDVLEGDVLSDDVRITYASGIACLTLDGRDDDGRDCVVEMRAPASRLKDFSIDIQVARASEDFDRELRSLTDG